MSIIAPTWYAEQTEEVRAALREKFADRPANELDVSVNMAAVMAVAQSLMTTILAMDGHNQASLTALKETVEAFRVAGGVMFAISTDDVVDDIWKKTAPPTIEPDQGDADE